MAFAQIIEFRTSDIDQMRQIDQQWWQATEGKRTARSQMLARDHADPDKYYAVVFFDSYDSAMRNSALPETGAAAEQYRTAADGPPVFRDLDIIDQRS